MNLFYEEYPKALEVHGEFYPIITDFREYIRLLDMLKCKELNEIQRIMILGEYFLTDISIDQEAIHALTGFVTMDLKEKENNSDSEEEGEGQEETEKKNLFSYEIDYPYILSGFLRDYGIDLETGGNSGCYLMVCRMILRSSSGLCTEGSTYQILRTEMKENGY